MRRTWTSPSPRTTPPTWPAPPVVFKVKVHEVKERQEPTVDDEFAKDVSEFDTLAELEKSLRRTSWRKRREERADQEL